ncbi:hypothetical protein RhiXN_10641 [Rhizoctonia solani]|uniref:Uncharacterized protein n=1 Tax=Rhizoctonia solani TaxID=456999 RepID=A0A8H8P680_9AGAM|nr:uncharacterized protein RhiXN_10641 [Rhizoctonia solani]QRW24317.1 hypothetical protein RhiXN_10641 [Rhizoctonia solani]
MVNSVSSATAPVGGTATDLPARYLKGGKFVKITFPNGTQKTVPTIEKTENIKKCKGLEGYMDFGVGKTFPHGMWLDIKAKFRNDLASMLGNVGVTWELVPYNVRAAVLVSTKAAYPVLYRFPEDWAGKALMKTICKNKRDTKANKQGRLRGGRMPIQTPLSKAPRKIPPKKSPPKKSPSRKSPSKKSPSRKSPSKKSPSRKSPPKKSPPKRARRGGPHEDDVGVRVSSTRTADLGKKRCRIEDSDSEDEPEVKRSPSARASKSSSCTHKPAASNTPATKAKTPTAAAIAKSAKSLPISKPSPPPKVPPATVKKAGIGKTTNRTAPITKSTNTGASPSLKRKAQPEPGPGVESNLETATKPAKPPPTKRQKGSVHTKGKVSGRSNSWAQNCQDEVSQLESAITAALNTAVAPVSEPSDSVPKPRIRPKPRPPPQDLSATTSHAAKSEMVNEFDLSKTVPMKTRAAAKKK